MRKAVDLSPFLFCPNAEQVLQTLATELATAEENATNNETGFCGLLATEIELTAVKRCLEKLPNIAKRDLGIKPMSQ